MPQASACLLAPAQGRNPSPAYPTGTRIYATCALCDVLGPLVGDHEDLYGIVRVYDEAEGDVVALNGWLWCIDVLGEVRHV